MINLLGISGKSSFEGKKLKKVSDPSFNSRIVAILYLQRRPKSSTISKFEILPLLFKFPRHSSITLFSKIHP